jgi:hypothetical protein
VTPSRKPCAVTQPWRGIALSVLSAVWWPSARGRIGGLLAVRHE